MRDAGLAVMLLTLAALAWRRPWQGVLGLVFLALVVPQGATTGPMRGLPAYQGLLGVVLLAYGWQQWRLRRWPPLPSDWRLAVLLLLCVHMLLTTWLSLNPWAAWPRLLELSKRLPLLLLIVLLIDSADKLRWLLLTLALSVFGLILKGGFWALITGFQDRVYGPADSQFSDNNLFAVVTAIAIPLMVLWYRQTENWPLRLAIAGGVALAFASALSSWSRGGLLCVAAVALLLVWHSRRKWLALPLLLSGIVLVAVGLPDAWFARMQTLAAPQDEGSAATRLKLWRLGWDYALQHPWAGGGFDGWIYLSTTADGSSRIWHSAYVDLLAEHGFVGLGLWALLVLGSVVSLSRVLWAGPGRSTAELADQAAMLRISIVAYLVGAAFLSIAYWELLLILLAAAIRISLHWRAALNPQQSRPEA